MDERQSGWEEFTSAKVWESVKPDSVPYDKIKAPATIQCQNIAQGGQQEVKQVVTPGDWYLPEGRLKKEISNINSQPNQYVSSMKRLPNHLRTYYPMSKKAYIKTEEPLFSESSIKPFRNCENVLVKANEINEPEIYFEPDDQKSDIVIEKFDSSQISFDSTYYPMSSYVRENRSACGSVDSEPEVIVNNNRSTNVSQKAWLQNRYLGSNIPNHKEYENNLYENRNDSESSDDIPLQEVWHSHFVNRTQSNTCSLQASAQTAEQTPSSSQGLRLRTRAPYQRICEEEKENTSDLSNNESRLRRVKKWKTQIDRRDRVDGKINKTMGFDIQDNMRRSRLDSLDKNTYHDGRRITRSFIKHVEPPSSIGKFVWGYCKGWWPSIIVSSEDVGIESKPDKVCVYWIGEDLISLLNEKTQVEPFQSNLEMRLLKYLEDDRVAKDRRKATFVTLKLFSTYLKIPLIKPYVAWVKNHLMHKSQLNDIRFYPFPKNMQQRLDQLKEKNMKEMEKRMQCRNPDTSRSSSDFSPNEDLQDSVNKNDSQRKFPKDFVRKSTAEILIKSLEQHILPLVDQKPGVIVWGKICGHSWWPAMIIHHHDCGTKEPNYGCQWIIWYGDYQLSQVHYLNVMKFDEGIKKMSDYIKQCKREIYLTAVLNACKDHCNRLAFNTTNWRIADVLSWASSFSNNLQTTAVITPNDACLKSRYSSLIAEKLNEMKSNQGVAVEREKRIKNSESLKAIFNGLPNILNILCIICLKNCYDGLQDHPFFECAVCCNCLEELKAAIFAYGDDGKCFFCTLCGGSDTVVMCDNYDCPRVYCTACLKYLICPTTYNKILLQDPWFCFLCEAARDPNEKRIFKPRLDWKTRIGQLFHTNKDTNWMSTWNNVGRRKRVRVLSLFDGISTGLLVLEKLGIEVEDYYAAEIDSDAEIVSTAHFGERISRLGDVRNITKDLIAAIAPIDLLIGGSPCNDLSLVNPNRLGLHDPNGSGVLFFDYCRIKKLVEEVNEGHHLFWLFENVASMPSKYRFAINESLQCEPSLIDAADFSAQHRPRLFWSNLPIGLNFPFPNSSQDLQSVLTPNCDRHALVKKIRTVTTKVNSLKQGISLLKPVLMNGEADSLWITELEQIFGFPKHYTDVKNLSATKRQKLIGQSWSVQTITAILRPLCYFFVTQNSLHKS